LHVAQPERLRPNGEQHVEGVGNAVVHEVGGAGSRKCATLGVHALRSGCFVSVLPDAQATCHPPDAIVPISSERMTVHLGDRVAGAGGAKWWGNRPNKKGPTLGRAAALPAAPDRGLKLQSSASRSLGNELFDYRQQRLAR
jgi:hypothetical protein